MTQRLYYTNAYAREFTSTVVAASDDGTRVYLAETAFYPTSGGQPHDLGMLGGVPVIDVVDEEDRVAHVLATPLAVDGKPLKGVVDWERRYDHMQQHTGQHLLSAVFEDLFGFKTVSVHFGPDYSTLDLDTETLSRRQIIAAEERANAIVAEARPVNVSFEDAATATGLRKPSERGGTLRIVNIDSLDRSACGGTHVESTAEIGPILLRATEKVRKATRVEFVCGFRAVKRARKDYESLSGVASSLSASLDDHSSRRRLSASRRARPLARSSGKISRPTARANATTPQRRTRTVCARSSCAMPRRWTM